MGTVDDTEDQVGLVLGGGGHVVSHCRSQCPGVQVQATQGSDKGSLPAPQDGAAGAKVQQLLHRVGRQLEEA
jgi:hypothetical protein